MPHGAPPRPRSAIRLRRPPRAGFPPSSQPSIFSAPFGQNENGSTRGDRAGVGGRDVLVAQRQADEHEVAARGDFEETKRRGNPRLRRPRRSSARRPIRRRLWMATALAIAGRPLGPPSTAAVTGAVSTTSAPSTERVGAGARGAAADRGVAVGRQDGVPEAAGRAVDRDDRGSSGPSAESEHHRRPEGLPIACELAACLLLHAETRRALSRIECSPFRGRRALRGARHDPSCSWWWTCGWAWWRPARCECRWLWTRPVRVRRSRSATISPGGRSATRRPSWKTRQRFG